MLRISNSDSTASALATASDPTLGIVAEDYEVLSPATEGDPPYPVAFRPATTNLPPTITTSPDPSTYGLDHLQQDDVILVTSRSSPLNITRPLAPRASALTLATATASVASPVGINASVDTTFSATTTLDADSAYLDASTACYTDIAMTASMDLADLAALTAAVAATALNSDDSEEDNEGHEDNSSSPYQVPASTEVGPFYVVTRGLQVGIFAGWCGFLMFNLSNHSQLRSRGNTSPLVTGVSNAVFSRVASVHEGHNRMRQAIASGFVKQLHK